jgi:hypothetical protein
MAGTPLYTTWTAMLERCRNPKHISYEHYGGRGISVCKSWERFENFYKDVGEKPTPEMTLDRIENDGNYEPGNVRWATRREQAANSERAILVTLNGVTKTLVEWCEIKNLNYKTIHTRILNGRTPETAITDEILYNKPIYPKDLTGLLFGRLTVIGRGSEKSSNGVIKWLCECECGNRTQVARGNLTISSKAGTTSCGCKLQELASENRSKYRGVIYDKARAKWKVQISYDGITSHIGRYDTEENAANAYSEKYFEIFNQMPISLKE